MKSKRKLSDTIHKITNGQLMFLGQLDFPIIPQHDALPLNEGACLFF